MDIEDRYISLLKNIQSSIDNIIATCDRTGEESEKEIIFKYDRLGCLITYLGDYVNGLVYGIEQAKERKDKELFDKMNALRL